MYHIIILFTTRFVPDKNNIFNKNCYRLKRSNFNLELFKLDARAYSYKPRFEGISGVVFGGTRLPLKLPRPLFVSTDVYIIMLYSTHYTSFFFFFIEITQSIRHSNDVDKNCKIYDDGPIRHINTNYFQFFI